MKYIICLLSLLVTINSNAFLFKKEKTSFTLANCKSKPELKFTCCVYDQIEDGIKVVEWVPHAILVEKQKTSSRGRANPCDSLGVGIYRNVTYSYGASDKCTAKSPIYKSKGQVYKNKTLAAICKASSKSDKVNYF